MYIWNKAIDNAGPYDVTPKTACRRIEVREHVTSASPPTTDLNQFDPTDKNGARGCSVLKGTSAIFSSPVPFSPTTGPAGYINTASGNITVDIIEHEAV